MVLGRFLAIGAFAATVACSGSTPTMPGSGQVLPPGGQMGGTSQSPSASPGDTVGVTIQDFTFSPAMLTIKAGTSVRWTNDGPSAHTTTSDTGVWTSGVLSPPGMAGSMSGGGGSPGGTFDFTFTQPGTYPYHCSLHPPNIYPGFVGTVTVTP